MMNVNHHHSLVREKISDINLLLKIKVREGTA